MRSGVQEGRSDVLPAPSVVMMIAGRTVVRSCAKRGPEATSGPAGDPSTENGALSMGGASGAALSDRFVVVSVPPTGFGEKLAVTPSGSPDAASVMSPLEPLKRRSGSGLVKEPPSATNSALPGHTLP